MQYAILILFSVFYIAIYQTSEVLINCPLVPPTDNPLNCYAHPLNCSCYIQCPYSTENGTLEIVDCPSGLIWNDNEKKCDNPENSTCIPKYIAKSGIATKKPDAFKVARNKTASLKPGSTCSIKCSSKRCIFADKANCSKYWICIPGLPGETPDIVHNLLCDNDMEWNNILKLCVDQSNATCNNKHSTATKLITAITNEENTTVTRPLTRPPTTVTRPPLRLIIITRQPRASTPPITTNQSTATTIVRPPRSSTPPITTITTLLTTIVRPPRSSTPPITIIQPTATTITRPEVKPPITKNIIIYLCITFSILICIGIFILFKSKIKRKKFKEIMMKVLIDKKLFRERHTLVLKDIIGQGRYGLVYNGLYNDGSSEICFEVAVKTVRIGCKKKHIESCFNEGILLSGFNHDRILTPIGVCIEEDSPMVILPIMSNGDLLSYLRKNEKLLTVKQLINYATQVSQGMVFLSKQNFIHRDLAARNILLDSKLNIKIGDFGLSRDIYAKHYYRSNNKDPLPLKWMAIECIEKGLYNVKTDVWSFGVLFWEILSRGQEPYPIIESALILKYIKSGNRLPKPSNCLESLYKLLLSCWDYKPENRPDFVHIEVFLKDVIEHIEQSNNNVIGNASATSYVTISHFLN